MCRGFFSSPSSILKWVTDRTKNGRGEEEWDSPLFQRLIPSSTGGPTAITKGGGRGGRGKTCRGNVGRGQLASRQELAVRCGLGLNLVFQRPSPFPPTLTLTALLS